MTEIDSENVGRRMAANRAKSRGYASFFEWRLDRGVEEHAVSLELSRSLENAGLAFFEDVRPRSQGEDPPDCEASLSDGSGRLAIELTELVSKDAIEAFRKTRFVDWAEWPDEQFVDRLAELIAKKDQKVLKGGPYAQYALLIYTDEPMLPYSRVRQVLDGVAFAKPQQIDRAFLLMSYDPREQGYPVQELHWRDEGAV
jgi:hypothetical protein